MSFLLSWAAYAQQVEIVRLPPEKVSTNGPYLRFDPFTLNDSTINNAVDKEMRIQDSRGYLWFITNDSGKLVRYDGAYSTTYQSSYFMGVMETDNGVVFAPTGEGIALYDSIHDRFVSYKASIPRDASIWPSTPSKGHKVYLSFRFAEPNTSTLFFEFDVSLKKFKRLPVTHLINGYTRAVEGNTDMYMARPFNVDHQGKVWGQINCRKESALGYYDPATQQLVWYPLEGAVSPDFMGPQRPYQSLDIYYTFPEPDNKYVWTGGWWHTGLLRFNRKTNRWKQYYFAEIGHNRPYSILPFGKTKLILTTEVGVCIFDKETGAIHQYQHLADNAFTPPKMLLQPIGRGKSTVWIGLGSGTSGNTFSVLDSSRQYFRTIPQHPFYRLERPLYKYGQHIVFLYRNDQYMGMADYDAQTGQFKTLYQEKNERLSGFQFQYVLRDTINHVVWFAGSSAKGSIVRWKEGSSHTETVKEPIEGLPYQTHQIGEIQGIAQDKNGDLWFPTGLINHTVSVKAHLIKYDSRTKRFKAYLEGTHGLPANAKIRSMMRDSRGIIWLGYRSNSQIVWFDPRLEKSELKTQISQNGTDNTASTLKMMEDTVRKVVWIAAVEKGLWKYDMRNDAWKQIVFKDAVLNIHLTKDGNIWIKTAAKIIRFTPETGKTREFGEEYDLSKFEYGPFSKMEDDELFFEKFRFYPHEISDDTLKPKAVFSFVRVFDRALPNPQNLNYVPSLTLRYNQNFFTIGFSILSYFQRGKNQYAYRLQDFNQEWVQVGNNPLATFTNVAPGEYELQIKGANADGVWSEIRSLKIIITPPFWQTWWFRGLMILLCFAILFAGYRYRMAQLTLKSRLEAEEALRKQREAEYQQRIAQTEITALRAQMNPHFIFNCLNSIQYYTAQNEADTASEYLTKFSRLIRLVLENSRSEKVTLTNELETLRLYIEMEAMRFQQKVRYEIHVDPEVHTDTIQIPPLLIQPFVENAIWHGLMHKEAGGTVEIEVTQPRNNSLRISIADDGVGREKAAEYKSKSATKHKSFGMKVTAERIELINQLYQTNTKIEIIDLSNADGQVVGTKVIVEIPI